MFPSSLSASIENGMADIENSMHQDQTKHWVLNQFTIKVTGKYSECVDMNENNNNVE